MSALEAIAGPRLRCPACGNDGSRGEIRYLVDAVLRGEVLALKDRVLEVEGPARVSVTDPHKNPRFECLASRPAPERGECLHRWRVPDGIARVTWRVPS